MDFHKKAHKFTKRFIQIYKLINYAYIYKIVAINYPSSIIFMNDMYTHNIYIS